MVQSQSSNDLGAQVCRNITVAGRRTSIRMEMVFWSELQRISEKEKRNLNELITMIDGRKGTSNLTAAIRVFIVCYIRALREEAGSASGEVPEASGEGGRNGEPGEEPEGGPDGTGTRRTEGRISTPAGTAPA